MGKDLADELVEVKTVFEQADEVLGRSISSICFEGPESELKQTLNTQVALFVVDCACFLALETYNVKPIVVAGHSLGEYAALVAAGVLEFSDGLRLVNHRASLMQEDAIKTPGKMVAVLGLDKTEVEKNVDSLKDLGVINVANYNCPGQIVVSGEVEVVSRAREIFNDLGAKKVIELPVSGGFHSSLMNQSQKKLAQHLNSTPFSDAKIPVVSNFTSRASTKAADIKDALKEQITGSVRWKQSVEEMIKRGITTFTEVGPKRVLSGLIIRIVKDAEVLNVEDTQSLNRLLSSVSG